MKLCPGQNKTFLAPWKRTSQTLDLRDIIDSHIVLIIRVEVRHMMLSSCLDEHANDNSEEPSNLWHHSSNVGVQRPPEAIRWNDWLESIT